MKTISIIVAAYNMEDYLGKCLDSVVDHKWDDSVEVIVVNDGSKDKTLQIARQYQSEYPKIVTVIDKENGHHGSCTNAALPVAKGKYVKILDADDWYNTDAFTYLIAKLQTLDSDMVITNYSEQYPSGKTKLVRYCSQNYTIRHDTTNPTHPIFPSNLMMHAVAYRTEFLRRMNYKQSEGVAYTDEEWVVLPVFHVETVAFVNADVYQYFLGRPGQTTDPAIFYRDILHLKVRLLRIIEYYFSFDRKTLSQHANAYLFHKLKENTKLYYDLYLLRLSNEEIDLKELKSIEAAIREKNEDYYESLSKERIHKCMPIKYIRYFRKHEKRLPSWCLYIVWLLQNVKRILTSFV
jgi:glycosyltransferase involved in cell wall biosynthesis